jgi:predicted RNA binding protein YcfA (HicA-like mRNA interferase family)
MPDKLPQVSGRRAAQAFVRAGWIIREEGPHIIPNHRQLKKGTLHSLIRKAGLTVAEFIRLLS